MRQTQNTQKNSNKKSVFIIALLLLLVAVIGFGGYTMSKYISSKSDEGKASVAKWGFTVSANADDLFGTDYAYNATDFVSKKTTSTSASLTVSAATPTSGTRSNLVAPGTTGSMTIKVNGKAEVKSQVVINLSNVKDVKLVYTKDGAQSSYTPVKWTLKKNGADVTGAVNVDLETLANKLNAETAYDPNTEVNDTYTLSWAWDFENGTGANSIAQDDVLDTLLGRIANGESITTEGDYTIVAADTSTEISFDLSVSVTQLKGNE